MHGIVSRLPLVLGLIAIITLVLLFLLTGSVVLPVKSLALNVPSLTAAFGAIVWIFQDGHLGGFGTTATGTLVANMPVLLFCIAFGLSMDYEVFLISRIREFWLGFGDDGSPAAADNDESVALGVAHTARVITAAALIMAITFAALAAAQLSALRLFGVGLTVAVLVDATLVRLVLVPAFMHGWAGGTGGRQGRWCACTDGWESPTADDCRRPHSAAGPVRRPLLGERDRALLGVVRPEHRHHDLGLVLPLVLR